MVAPSHLAHVGPGPAAPEVVHVVVEIPKGSRNKYELDEASGLFRLDRYLYSATHYPGDYGFVPATLSEDGDALDALVMVSQPTFTGCLIRARVLGVFRMIDDGDDDEKLLTVPDSDPLFAMYRDLDDVPPHFLREVEHFFSTYKQLEERRVEARGWLRRGDALRVVREAIARFGAH
ncbi:MAG: inorganic diphosphatase [Planctomycetes bacterium]|nr:inorganic diphosphatase [Planctomycetota bacterium]